MKPIYLNELINRDRVVFCLNFVNMLYVNCFSVEQFAYTVFSVSLFSQV